MNEKSGAPSIGNIQKSQIEDWLRQADKHIRAGRYIAADRELQKVFEIDPTNELAESFQGRIQFFIKQLSQRVGMNVELQAEIRKYHDIVVQRKSSEVQSFIVKAQKALEDGYFKKAAEFTTKALAIDTSNSYANALKLRIEELQKNAVKAKTNSESEQKFRAVLQETWRSGPPSGQQITILNKLQQQLDISDGKRLGLEREIRNVLYKTALQEIWNTGGISSFTPAAVDELRSRFSVSSIDHSVIESELLKEVRKNKMKGSILVIDEDESLLLEIVQHLRSNSYAVTAAGTIEEAVKTLKNVLPDVIISEVNFAGSPLGFELFEFIRSDHNTRHIPFFFTTQSLDRTTHIIGKRLGVDDFIIKPIDYELMLASMAGKLRDGVQSKRNTSSRK